MSENDFNPGGRISTSIQDQTDYYYIEYPTKYRNISKNGYIMFIMYRDLYVDQNNFIIYYRKMCIVEWPELRWGKDGLTISIDDRK